MKVLRDASTRMTCVHKHVMDASTRMTCVHIHINLVLAFSYE